MDVAGQGSHGCRRHTLDDAGYLMAVLLVGMAVAAVWMAALLPAWRHQEMRNREYELIFRGEQYARAIALYYRKNNSQLPTSVDVLIQGHFLRKKWLDPVTRDEFIYLGAMVPGQLSSSLGTQKPGQPGSLLPPPGSPSGIPPTSGRQQGVALPPPTGPQGQVIPGMYGVQSKSGATSIKVHQGQQQHNLWRFDFRESLQAMGTPAGGGPRGNPSDRGNPGTGPGAPGRTPPGGTPGAPRGPFGPPGGPGAGPPGVGPVPPQPPPAPQPPRSGGS